MSWYYYNELIEEIADEYIGFVYIITNLTNNRKYIGKKLTKFAKTTVRTVKLKNGSRRKKRIRNKIESDWKNYYGSNDQLLADIAQLGTDKFRRDILYFCKTKAECSYVEAREQFSRRVLESDDYYNGHIQVRVHGSNIKGKQLNG
jgi:hypothetical protein